MIKLEPRIYHSHAAREGENVYVSATLTPVERGVYEPAIQTRREGDTQAAMRLSLQWVFHNTVVKYCPECGKLLPSVVTVSYEI